MSLSYLKLLRPHQWIKNLLLLFPPFFAGKILDHSVISNVLPTLAGFSCVASCGYIINDIIDSHLDKNCETKKNREIACGRISVRNASAVALMLLLFAIAIAILQKGGHGSYYWFVVLYLLNSLLYTLFLKNIAILDLMAISFGFVLRVLAGGEVFKTPVSNWLFLTVFAVALLLADGKRLGEMVSMGAEASKHRTIYSQYSQSFLEGILWFSASAACVMYSLYTVEHHNGLFYTVPLVTFGLLRYIFNVKQGRGDPTEGLLGDRQILSVAVLWLGMIGAIIY